MRRRLALAAGVAAAALAMSACTPELPAPPTVPSPDKPSALLEEQADRVIEETFAQLEAADAARDPDLLGDRIGGDAARVRAAQYLRAEDDGPSPSELPSSMQAVYVTQAEIWPRVMIGVSDTPEESTPVVGLWVQDDIRTPYQLRGWAPMLPGATLPSMPSTSTGASQLSLTDDSVEPSPRQALDDYLELLREGEGSELSDLFEDDIYRDRLFSSRETLTEAADDVDGDYIDTIQPRIEGTFALSTAEGGTLIFAPVTIASSFSVEGATVSVPSADRPLVDGDLDDKVTHHYRDLVVIFVPGPDAEGLPAVVAADHHLVRVSDS